MADLFEAFSAKALSLIEYAGRMGEELGCASIAPAHLLLAFLDQRGPATKRQIALAGGDATQVVAAARALVEVLPRLPEGDTSQPQVDAALTAVLTRAEEIRVKLESKRGGPNHLLLALVSDPAISGALAGSAVDLVRLEAGIRADAEGKRGQAEFEALTEYGVDLTQQAAEGELDRVFGRDAEIRQVIQSLSRRTKNNPMIIGEPGVGKTALVEGLALRIANGDVPDDLRSATLFALDMGRLVAGTKFRGEFEERLKHIIEEAAAADNVIVFIDEIHTLIGTGAQEGGLDAANLLKPALSRGKLRCIGATTLSEYRKRIEKDTALVRRFQLITCEEPSPEQSISILRGLKDRYEQHHGVRITDAALCAAVRLSHRYLPDRMLPDKAIDIMDQASAARRMEIFTKPEAIEAVDRSIIQIEIELKALEQDVEEDKAARIRSEELTAELTELREQSDTMTAAWRREKEGVAKVRAAKADLEAARKELEQMLRALGGEDFARIEALLNEKIPLGEQELEAARRELDLRVAEEDFARAGELQHKIIPALEKERDAARRDLEQKLGELPPEDVARVVELQREVIPAVEKVLLEYRDIDPVRSRYTRGDVNEEDVAEAISKLTGIPVSKMLDSERGRLQRMEEELGQRVVGQDEAVVAIAKAVRRSRAGLQDPSRPIASFLMLGPTGVGKTELAKALAEFLFDDEEAMLRLDMSEFMEKHSAARLVGAPPGYVGFEEGGILTNKIKRKPYSVILFDEVEKAHPDVFNLLLQVLDDGRLTDNQSHTVSFANTVLILTSNLGSEAIVESKSADDVREAVMEAVKGHFRPEFLNRLDEVLIFNRLRLEDMRPIVEIQLARLGELLKDRRIELNFDPAVLDLLAAEGHDPFYGARPLKRLIQRRILDPLSEAIIDGRVTDDQSVEVALCDDKIIITPSVDGVPA
ncbi:MAG: AAA family ATPase [Planctomycetes bacterium]|nr:AAA family ATPase [Planctomycetota bacterium]